MSSRLLYVDNGTLGVLAHLIESKLIFADEYELLRVALVNPLRTIKGAEKIMESLVDKQLSSYRVEDMFNLIGVLAKTCSQSGKALKLVKLNGELDKLPFGSTGRSFGRWKTRYFRLNGNGLMYYGQSTDMKPKGSLILTPDTVLRDGKTKSNCFDIITRNGTLCVYAHSEKEKELWVAGISRAIHASRIGRSARANVEAPSINIASGGIVDYREEREARMRADSEVDMSMSGHLHKLSIRSRRNWKDRYFVLYRNLFSYYEDEEQSRSKGDFILDLSAIVIPGLPPDMDESALEDGLSLDCCFYVSSPDFNFTLVLAAKSSEQKTQWVMAIQNAIDQSSKLLDGQATVTNARVPANGSREKGDAFSIEIILAQGVKKSTNARSVGCISVFPHDTLVALRDRIYKELDDSDIPLDFAFLLNLKRTAAKKKQEQETDVLARVIQSDYTKISSKQEAFFGIDKIVEDDNKLFLYYTDMHISNDTKATTVFADFHNRLDPSLPPVPPVPVKTDLAKKLKPVETTEQNKQQETKAKAEESAKSDCPGGGAVEDACPVGSTGGHQEFEDLKQKHTEERKKWEKEIRRLRSELAETRNALILAQQGGSGKTTAGGRSLSPLEGYLMELQRDGYIEETVTLKTLAKEYRKLFSADDITTIILYTSSPFNQLKRRFASNPQHIRQFLEGVQDMLKLHTIPYLRLSEPWWKKKLQDVSIIKLEKGPFAEWAKAEPWCEDTPERYAYLMGKMRPGAVTDQQTTFLRPIPEYVEEDESDDSSADDNSPLDIPGEEHEEKEKQTPNPPRPAFLGAIQGLNKEKSSQPKPAFLSGIQGFQK
eukprot:CAMPEP_0203763800 /NCGR_PEP_ID=MMETSP0098-20131031/16890_1 /ASSEMBLY_ACC=CAM_ASM_000208 /TAXON_ID=96639 /ORGANISM=" , Strain NY0313808BC1" /LENGTH=827 /DNA_ID=CAMNT_0050659041 /DNA_START=565 /DNA_END=3045 /DNA_ORIENTATION=+